MRLNKAWSTATAPQGGKAIPVHHFKASKVRLLFESTPWLTPPPSNFPPTVLHCSGRKTLRQAPGLFSSTSSRLAGCSLHKTHKFLSFACFQSKDHRQERKEKYLIKLRHAALSFGRCAPREAGSKRVTGCLGSHCSSTVRHANTHTLHMRKHRSKYAKSSGTFSLRFRAGPESVQ